jgi:hypothetical protein
MCERASIIERGEVGKSYGSLGANNYSGSRVKPKPLTLHTIIIVRLTNTTIF